MDETSRKLEHDAETARKNGTEEAGNEAAASGKSDEKGAVRKKRSIKRKILDKFFGDDPVAVSERVKNEVMLPGLKDLGYNILMSALSMAFWGEVRGGYTRPSGRSSRDGRYEDYTRYSDSRSRAPASNMRSSRPSYDYGEIIFASQRKAQEALDHLDWCIERYHQASVADLNEAAELSSKYTDRYYGWFDLRGASIHPTSEGWVLDLPPAEPIRTQ